MMEQQEGMEEMQEAGQAEAGSKLDVGATLREAREALGISMEEVAVRIKFAPRQIEALEANRWDELPELAFIRGFVRSYARLLELDPEALLAAMPGGHVKPATSVRPRKEDVNQANALAFRQNLVWLAGGLMVAVAVILLAWKYNAGEAMPKRVAATTGQMAEAPAGPAPESAVEAASQPVAAEAAVADTAAPAVAVTEAAPAAPKPAPHPQPVSQAKPAAPVKPQAASAVAQSAAPTASEEAAARAVPPDQRGPSQQVRLEFDEDSWIELYDGSGKTLLSTLGKAGGSLRASGPTPLTLTIGHLPGVHLYYKGQPLDLSAHSGKSVVRLKLE